MAILGGAGNPVGGSFTGPAEALEYLRGKDKVSRCYAFSGEFAAIEDEQTLFDFTSSSGYIMADLVCSGDIEQGNGAGGITTWQLKYNGATVLNLKTETYADRVLGLQKCPVVIPPYTEVTLTAKGTADVSNFFITAHVIGRVYH